MILRVACFLGIICILVCLSKTNDCIQVRVSQGVLQGVSKTSSEGKEFFAFLGIPYAKPPVRELRFQPPEPAVSWDGTRDATAPGSACLQYDNFLTQTVEGSEDCLFLNVFSKNLATYSNEEKLPVVVFIHGGAFIVGSGSPDSDYGPEFLMNRDIVLVTLNYRLGAFGFLSTGNTLISGNMGLKDQSFALKWIKENIESFGGDSNRVIIYGVSSGGVSVHYQMLSPMSKGLFSGAISMSGTALSKWAFMNVPLMKKHAKFIAEYVDCPTDLNEETVKCLKEANGFELAEAVTQIKDYGMGVSVPLAPIVEPKGSKDIFLSENPTEIIRKGHINDVPWLNGHTSNEGLSFLLADTFHPVVPSIFYDDFRIWFGVKCELHGRVKNFLRVVEKAKHFYFSDRKVIRENLKDLSAIMSDAVIVHSTYRAVQMHLESENIKSPVYLFRLSAHPDRSASFIGLFSHGRDITDLGVGHTEDIGLVFNIKLLPAISSERDKTLSNNFINFIVNFANTGNPNGLNESTWKPLTSQFHYTDINLQLEEREDFPLHKMKFWDKILDEDGRSQCSNKNGL